MFSGLRMSDCSHPCILSTSRIMGIRKKMESSVVHKNIQHAKG